MNNTPFCLKEPKKAEYYAGDLRCESEQNSSLLRHYQRNRRCAPPQPCPSVWTGAPLTNYKKDVDNVITYGLFPHDLKFVKLKIQKQRDFLKYSYITNNMTGQSFSLEDCMVSANHNSHRYYGEIQNRVKTLEREATNENLVPTFLTLTLPSEFHRMKQKSKNDETLVRNPKFNGTTPKESVKILTKMFTRLRHDRSLKDLPKNKRMYYRVNEPHKDGTPHTHILLFIPREQVDRVKKAFKRLYNSQGNKFVDEINKATGYLMKYINKTLNVSKDNQSLQEEYINGWYVKNRIYRFSSSRSLAPMYLYRLLHNRFTLFALTQVRKGDSLKVLARMDDDKIMEVWDNEELLFLRNENITVHKAGERAA